MNKIKVTMVGTGSAFSKLYYNTSALVEFEDYRLLIDCGHNVPKGLYDLGYSWSDIDGILITHIHSDHVGGLEEAALSNRYLYNGRKMDLLVPTGIKRALWDSSLKGGLLYTDEGRTEGLDEYFNVHSLSIAFAASIDDHKIRIHRTNHVKEKLSYGVQIDNTLFYTSDTKYDSNLLEKADRCNHILHDCQLFTGGIHSSLEELKRLPEAMQEKILLMHYGDDACDYVNHTGKMKFAVQGQEYEFDIK